MNARFVLGVLGGFAAAGAALGVLVDATGVADRLFQPEIPDRAQGADRFCADTTWLDRGAELVYRTYPNPERPLDEGIMRRAMEYGHILHVNYLHYVDQGLLPAGLEDGLTEWAVYLTTTGPPSAYRAVARSVINRCRQRSRE